MEKKLLNAEELAEYLSLGKGNIYKMRSEGQIPAGCTIRFGRAIRFVKVGIDAWLKERSISGASASDKKE